jgi:hypothetical protein
VTPVSGIVRAFVEEAIDSIDGSALLIAPQHEERVGVLDLAREKETKRLDGIATSIDIVTEKEELGRVPSLAVSENPDEVVELTVSVSNNRDRRRKLEKDRLRFEDRHRRVAQISDLVLCQVRTSPDWAAPDRENLLDQLAKHDDQAIAGGRLWIRSQILKPNERKVAAILTF